MAVRKSGRNYFLAQKRTQHRLSLVLKCLRVYTSVGGGAADLASFSVPRADPSSFSSFNHGGNFFFFYFCLFFRVTAVGMPSEPRIYAIPSVHVISTDSYTHREPSLVSVFFSRHVYPRTGLNVYACLFPYTPAACCFLNDHLCQGHIS